MLTKAQATVIQDIIEIVQESEAARNRNLQESYSAVSCGLISASRKDLERLKAWQLVAFEKGHGLPQVTRKGLRTLRQSQILRLLAAGLSQEPLFVDEQVACQLPDIQLEAVHQALVALRKAGLIDGELFVAPQSDTSSRFVSAWPTDKGRAALNDPDTFWGVPGAKEQPVRQPSSPIRLSQIADRGNRNKVSQSPIAEAHHYIEALRALAQSMPEDRRPQMVAMLNALSQTVGTNEQQCA